jgi:phosphoribosylformimino-5-aminoimidazole carboxamide ribotide isomerase
MLIVPVLDLKGGRAVHAVRGERDRYRPARSVLAPDGDAVGLARAYRDRLGCGTCYVADLDAIAGESSHADLLADLVAVGSNVWLDAGITTPDAAQAQIDRGVGSVILGSESLVAINHLAALADRVGPTRLIVSLDHRGGRLLSHGDIDRESLIAAALQAGIDRMIVLDLAQVGASAGPPLALLESLRARHPGVAFMAGGGVRDRADLDALARTGAAGALVATALHRGVLTAADLDPFDR